MVSVRIQDKHSSLLKRLIQLPSQRNEVRTELNHELLGYRHFLEKGGCPDGRTGRKRRERIRVLLIAYARRQPLPRGSAVRTD